MQLTSQLWGAVEPVARKHYGLEAKKVKPEFSQIFDVSKGKDAVRHSMEFGGIGQHSLKTEGANVDAQGMKQGSDKTWNWSLYAARVDLSWELVRDVNYRAIKNVMGLMGRSSKLTPEYLAADFLEKAFNSSYPATADGKELCATDHLIIGTSTSNGSNELSTPAALSETALQDVMTNLMTTKGPDGLIVPLRGEKLIVPPALWATAKKLTTSDKQVGSANNDPSVVSKSAGGFDSMVFRYLSSATRWFVKTDYSNGLWWEWDVEQEFMEDQVISNLSRTYVSFFRARWGCDDWRGIYGSAAS